MTRLKPSRFSYPIPIFPTPVAAPSSLQSGRGQTRRSVPMGIVLRTTFAVVVGVIIGAVALIPYTRANPAGSPAVPVLPAIGSLAQPTSQPSQSTNGSPPVANQAAAVDVSNVYDRVSPAVVNITFATRAQDVFGRTQQAEGTGSGFIIDDQGHVITNYHVPGGATRLDVTLADNSSYVGDLVASDQANDLALLKINAPSDRLGQLTVASLGDS